MKSLRISVSAIGVIALMAAQVHAMDTHDHDHAGGSAVTARDYIGIYLEVPVKVQNAIGMTIARTELSTVKEKVLLNGRVPQDVESITDVYAPRRGLLQACPAALGMRVKEGDVLCTLSTGDGETLDLTASAAGVVIAQFSKPGDTVDTIAPVQTIADYSRLSVTFDVYEKDVGKIQLNQTVLVYSSAYPDKTFTGTVTFISPRIDETSFTLKIRVLVDNPDYLLKPGMFLRGEAVLAADGEHVSVPADSVQSLDGIDIVFVQDEAESFVPTEVRVAYKDRRRTIINGDIRAGERVVVDGAYSLKSKILESEITGGCAHGH